MGVRRGRPMNCTFTAASAASHSMQNYGCIDRYVSLARRLCGKKADAHIASGVARAVSVLMHSDAPCARRGLVKPAIYFAEIVKMYGNWWDNYAQRLSSWTLIGPSLPQRLEVRHCKEA